MERTAYGAVDHLTAGEVSAQVAARTLIQAGKIGKPVWSQTSYCRNSVGGEWNYRIEDTASPDNLDWKAFLGSAPKRA